MVNQVLQEIEGEIYEGISTRKIYQKAFAKLKRASKSCASRYKLKKAILELGPSGYPFERFVGAILTELGYEVQVGVFINGKCVMHEVDVLAEKQDHRVLVECKFHNVQSRNSDVKVPLYIDSRFRDIKNQWGMTGEYDPQHVKGWVVTSTRFTEDATQYGRCAGLNMISWDYPLNKGLKNMIDELGLYPITCLNSLTKKEKQSLLEKEIVLCRELRQDPELLVVLGVKANRRKNIHKELEDLLYC